MRGSIRQRTEGGSWTAYWFTTDPGTGKRRQFSRGGFRIRGDAQKHLNAVLAKVDEGSWTPDTSVTVKALLEDHWLPSVASTVRPATRAQYQIVVDSWLVPNIGGIKAKALTPADVRKLQDTLRTTKTSTGRAGLSNRSIQLSVTLLKCALAWAAHPDQRLLSRNPLAGFKRPKADSRQMTAWSIDEAKAFLAATADDRLAAAWALFLSRGLRRGELAGLKWTALKGSKLEIALTRVVVDGKAEESKPKTAAGLRSIDLDADLISLLRTHKARQAAEKLSAGTAYEDGGWIFADELGRPYHPDYFSTRFERLVADHGLRPIRLHDLRHTTASLMLASGEPVKIVQELLGHSSPTITLSIYAHVLPGMAEDAGAKLTSRLLG
jgi:integrase